MATVSKTSVACRTAACSPSTAVELALVDSTLYRAAESEVCRGGGSGIGRFGNDGYGGAVFGGEEFGGGESYAFGI